MPYLRTRIRKLHREAEKDKGEGESINRYNTVRLSPPPDDKLITLDWVPLTAWVTFSPGLPGPAADNLYLKIGTKWVLLKDWLLSSYKSVKRLSDGSGLVGEKGYRAQRKWWKLNGKYFRLFDLPAEVRMTVFEFALGPRIYPLAERDSGSVRLGIGFSNWPDRDTPGRRMEERSFMHQSKRGLGLGLGLQRVTGCSAYEPNIALLSVNRQTYIEALQAGWENTRKCFFSTLHFSSVLAATTKPKYNWLNHIILDFTMIDWFDMFNLKDMLDSEPRTYLQKGNSKSFSTLLSTLDKLSTLQLWFRSPDEGHWWYPVGIQTILVDKLNNIWDDNDVRRTCCQRTMVDLIMTFAWPCVKDLRAKVTVGGILKEDTKKKWNELLALSAEDKVRVIDQEAAEQAIFNTLLAEM
ncbi:unnamed protein product [Alternaria alternata]